jgi:hypothetical protein
MAILLDPSAVVAAADAADLNHAAAVAWFARADEPLLLGALGLAELDLVLQRELGAAAVEAVLQALATDAIRLVAPTPDDLARAAVLMRRSTSRSSPMRCSSPPRNGWASGGLLASTAVRWPCSGRATSGRSTSSRRESKRGRRTGPVRWAAEVTCWAC